MIVAVMMIVNLRCTMFVSGAAIRAGLGLERRHRTADFRAEAFEHPFQNVIVAEAQVTLTDFDRHVSVAEVIGDLGQRRGRCSFDVQHTLRLRDNFNDAAVGGRDQIAAAQDLASRQYHADFFAR